MFRQKRKELGLPGEQAYLVIFDRFKAQCTTTLLGALEENHQKQYGKGSSSVKLQYKQLLQKHHNYGACCLLLHGNHFYSRTMDRKVRSIII